jgi:(R,R)-butanediol dehydrogenase/meso-butanediol dehydrogenase/diacetyl reductase
VSGSGMRAVRWHARRDVRCENVGIAPEPGAGEARVRVAWCGLCGSDVHEYLHGPFQIPQVPHVVTGRAAPITLGHEISGWVESVGPGPTELHEGDLVVLNALLPCGICRRCTRGALHLCPDLGHLGMSADGGLADFVSVPAAMIVRAPPDLDPAVAALAEPFAVAIRAVRQGGSPRSQFCLVVGAGTIGLAVALVLADLDNTVALVDVSPARLDHARRLGLDARAASEVYPRDIHEFGRAAQGAGASPPALAARAVFECSGAREALGEAIQLVDAGGVLVLAGIPSALVSLDSSVVVLRELRLVGSMSHLPEADLAPAVEFLARHPTLAGQLVTGRIPLEATVKRGLDELSGPAAPDHAKILVQVHDR